MTNQGDTTRIDLMDEIGFWGITAQDFTGELLAIDTATIELHISSPGGDVFDGLAIMNAIADHPAKVNGVIDGLAASAASFIAMACDTLKANRGSQVMVHDASGLCVGNAADMAEMETLLSRISDTIAGVYADKAGGTAEEWREVMRAETWYTGAEAVTAGLVDVAVGGPKSEEDAEDAEEEESEEDAPPDEDDEEEDEEDEEAEALAARHRQVLAAFKYPSRSQAPAPQLHPTDVVQFNPADFRAAIREGVTS